MSTINVKSTALLLIIGFLSCTNLYAYTSGRTGAAITGCAGSTCHNATSNYTRTLTTDKTNVLKGELVNIVYIMSKNGSTTATKSGFTMSSATGGILTRSSDFIEVTPESGT